MCLTWAAEAQHTSVEKNGIGGRIETDYNAAGKAIAMRTIGADGKLQQRTDYEYLPAYYGAQQTDTTYWPNGKVRKVTRHSYDESTNFTGEFIQAFDESGKQIGGHKLRHDPWTGLYECAEWNDAARDYKPVDCPAGEEESGGNRDVHKFTYDEVMKNLQAARAAAQREQTMPMREPMAMQKRAAGLILPAGVSAGERVSGTITDDAEHYEGMPGIVVVRIELPFEARGGASRLSGWEFETEGEDAQAADGPVSFRVPGRSSLKVVMRQVDNRGQSVTTTLKLPVSSGKRLRLADSFKAEPLCMKGELCVITGPFSGDSRKTFAAFGDRPARIVAESQQEAYLRIPERTSPGGRTLFLAEGSKVSALPVVIGELVINGNGRELKAGEKLIVSVALDGPGDLPENAWEGGAASAENLELAERLIPGFRWSGKDRERRETEDDAEHGEKKGAEILLALKNAEPQQFSLRSAKHDMLVFRLSEQAFERGEFTYNLLVEAKEAGKINITGYVVPFLAPVAWQEFTVQAPAR